MDALGQIVGAIGVVGIVSGLAWLFRLEGRINGHDGEHKEHRRRHDAIEAEHRRDNDQMREDLSYIRSRIDAALNGRHE